MPADPSLLQHALDRHRAGRLDEAEALYRAVLAADPRDADALHLLGALADARGAPAEAVALIGQALAVREEPQFHTNLGLALNHLGRHAEAVDRHRRALALDADLPEALNNLGASLAALNRQAEAVAAYRRVLSLRPGMVEAWTNLGHALHRLGRTEEAVAAYQQAAAHDPAGSRAPLGHALRLLGRTAEAEAAFRAELARRPDDPEVLNDLAIALGEDGQYGKAAALLSRAVALRPDYMDAHANLAQALEQLGRLGAAVAACGRALALRPDHAQALTVLGNALHGMDRLADAEAVLRRRLALHPAEVGGHNALAAVLQARDRPDEALAVLDEAVALRPDDADTRQHRAMLLLREGRLAKGWEEYEWRLRTRPYRAAAARYAGADAWRGEPLAGRTVLLTAEQGLGDTIQFVRYATLVAAHGGRAVLQVPKPLARLLRGLPGVDRLVTDDEPAPPFDLHCPLLSLPRAFGTTLDAVPADVPYLRPAPAEAARWAVRLGATAPGPRVGVAWAGNPRFGGDRRRSLPLDVLAPLWRVPGVRWFSLQVGRQANELAAAAPGPPGGITDLSPGLGDFADTAAAVAGLDLVISADTAVAHLAGALGRPVWLLVPHVPDWRWLRTGTRSPWYPTMRLFRQDGRRTWPPVVDAVARALRRWARSG